jgi:hypothetical protein
MTQELSTLMALIDGHLDRLELGAAKYLRPGLPPNAVVDELTARDLRAGDELIALFAWHDGTEVGPDISLNDMWLMPGYYLFTFEEALRTYDLFVNEFEGNPSWFPILEDNFGGYMFVDCARIDQQPVYDYDFENVNNELKHRSIQEMLTTIETAFSRGIFFKNSEGLFDKDWDLFWTMAGEINPSATYWWI